MITPEIQHKVFASYPSGPIGPVNQDTYRTDSVQLKQQAIGDLPTQKPAKEWDMEPKGQSRVRLMNPARDTQDWLRSRI